MNQQNIENQLFNIKKNINDLIAQEITLWTWAEMIVLNPELEQRTEKIWQKIYQNITINIESILVDLQKKQIEFWKDMQEIEIKKAVQTFIWELIQEKKEQLEEYIDTLKRIK
ncbi:MAG: hypothetical protein EAY69_04830 [Cytophagales bacterium]|nr:MAG: hypothetical protein EAY69_04830 [Cytophagales bacterium]